MSASSAPTDSNDLSEPREYFKALGSLIGQLPVDKIDDIADAVLATYHRRRSLIVFGNGGSAALASHCACDLGKGTANNGNRRLRVLSLTDNVPLITAWANDCAYEDVFAEQLRNLLEPGDLCFAISGSGNSPNVIKALRYSRESGATNVGIGGFNGGRMKDLCDICLVVPSRNMQLIEDVHVSISHAVFMAVKQRLVDRPRAAAVATF